jgi:hypothetical protein
MSSLLPIPSSTPPAVSRQTSNVNQAPVQGASSSVFGNLLRKTEVAIGMRSQSGFTSGATYDNQTIAGQTKATINNAVSATKSFLHIK